MKKFVVVDLDGTLSYVKCPLVWNWDWFYERIGTEHDVPIEPIAELVRNLHKSYRIIFCTGRKTQHTVGYNNVDVLQKTFDWLVKHNLFESDSVLLMRRPTDNRPDKVTKIRNLQILLKKLGVPKSAVAFVIDDIQNVVDAWREEGYTVLQPTDGTTNYRDMFGC